jgi:hypothetical protein
VLDIATDGVGLVRARLDGDEVDRRRNVGER